MKASKWQQSRLRRRDAVDERLITMVVAAAERHGYGSRVVRPDIVQLTGPNPGTIRVRELRPAVEELPARQWPEVVFDYVSEALARLETGHEEPVDLADFDAVRPLLRTRVYAWQPEDSVSAPLAPGLAEALVVELPRTLLTVTADRAAAWPADGAELLRIGRQQASQAANPESVHHHVEGVDITELWGGRPYVATCARRLDAYVATQAALVALPAADVVLCHASDAGADEPATRVLTGVAERVRQVSRTPLTDRVYRWPEEFELGSV